MSASSFHLFWQLPAGARDARLVEVSAVLEIVVPPAVPALYFWALQVDFVDGRGVWGGAHTGLQWNRRYPDNAAVNWGGYASGERGGGVLEGSRSSLPGFEDDANTVSYHWTPGRPYRLRVFRSPDVAGAWRADVTDMSAGATNPIRDLYPKASVRPGPLGRLFSRARASWHGAASAPGGEGISPQPGFLTRPMVWSEVFAACDDPSVTVDWRDFRAVDEDGTVWHPLGVGVNYQAAADGGCPNTDSNHGPHGGIVQRTNVERLVPQGTVLRLDGA